jgi:type IV secretory pathway TrbD component
MVALWIVAGSALIVAFVALAQARRTARQLAQVTEMYWQLKFDHGELKAKLDPAAPVPSVPQQTFVPLSSIKRP